MYGLEGTILGWWLVPVEAPAIVHAAYAGHKLRRSKFNVVVAVPTQLSSFASNLDS